MWSAITAECIDGYAIHYRILDVSVSWAAVPLVCSLSADYYSIRDTGHRVYY